MMFKNIYLHTIWLSCVMASAHAAYPDRPIRMVVPQTPGGSMDTNGRALADMAFGCTY